jgi:hypothetical protein
MGALQNAGFLYYESERKRRNKISGVFSILKRIQRRRAPRLEASWLGAGRALRVLHGLHMISKCVTLPLPLSRGDAPTGATCCTFLRDEHGGKQMG